MVNRRNGLSMPEAEFDAVASDYVAQHARSIRLSGEDVDYFARYKIVEARKITDRRSVPVGRIMDFGAGIGNSVKPMRELFPNARITCLDVSEKSLVQCRRHGTANTGRSEEHTYELQSLMRILYAVLCLQ